MGHPPTSQISLCGRSKYIVQTIRKTQLPITSECQIGVPFSNLDHCILNYTHCLLNLRLLHIALIINMYIGN